MAQKFPWTIGSVRVIAQGTTVGTAHDNQPLAFARDVDLPINAGISPLIISTRKAMDSLGLTRSKQSSRILAETIAKDSISNLVVADANNAAKRIPNVVNPAVKGAAAQMIGRYCALYNLAVDLQGIYANKVEELVNEEMEIKEASKIAFDLAKVNYEAGIKLINRRYPSQVIDYITQNTKLSAKASGKGMDSPF